MVIDIRGRKVGGENPLICVPVVATKADLIVEDVGKVKKFAPDVIEFRLDYYEDIEDHDKVAKVIEDVRNAAEDIPLMITVRTANEGGKYSSSSKDYDELISYITDNCSFDIIDIEAFRCKDLLERISEKTKDEDKYVLASFHDFDGTPSEADMICKFLDMDKKGADIVKIAVMPQSKRDVLNLISASLRYRENGGQKPVVAISMGDIGLITRVSAKIFDQAITFATAGEASAPGQIHIDKMREVFGILKSDNGDIR